MIHLDSNNIAAIIGVIGTIVGTILGFILNGLARIGKVKIFQNSVNASIFKPTQLAGMENQKEFTEDTVLVKIHLNIDFYNSSEQSKILRNIKFKIRNKDITIYDSIYKENFKDTGVLEFLNLQPKEIQNYKLVFSSWESLNEILNGYWFIEYRTHKNKLKRIKIKNNRVLMKGIIERVSDYFKLKTNK